MSTAIFPARLTVDEFLGRPERWDGNYEELIEGEVYVSPNNKKGHNDLVERIREYLRPLRDRGFSVQGEVACRVTDDSLPNTDVAVIQSDRWDAVDRNDYLREAPALAVEIASPGNRQLQRKASLYLEHGAEQVWIVYPKTQRVRVLTPEDDYDARNGETIAFQGIEINLADLFA